MEITLRIGICLSLGRDGRERNYIFSLLRMKLTNPNSRAEQPHTLIIVCLMQEIISCRLNHNFTHAIPGMLRFQLKQSQNQFKVNIERKLHSQRPSTCVICAFSCILISKINSKTLKYTNLFSSSCQSSPDSFVAVTTRIRVLLILNFHRIRKDFILSCILSLEAHKS
ncbi:Hypothetical_protein [Hexamita inflata]|uniref:Hypothetical_protein n=1 Tax=Hexamita inflata TaxID=28002 RepID=A0AA86NA79_9EUKA|nr:Hypothetical protein HINF_LOCUS3310 [Hexamita inflata]